MLPQCIGVGVLGNVFLTSEIPSSIGRVVYRTAPSSVTRSLSSAYVWFIIMYFIFLLEVWHVL